MTKETVEAQILNAASEAILFLTSLVRGDHAGMDEDERDTRFSAAVTLISYAGIGEADAVAEPEIVVEFSPE